jgi:holliday junction resolvase YEN1
MGIHGLLKELGPGKRTSLAALSSAHYTTHARPLRLAIDISIWLFQIQSGKGGSNPALRTFYYRLLRLLTLNIHPLFVFDGPNKPLFKRNKKVGGPGARVASVPEFLAKQLLKQFGFPWHVAPGEAEAECALLQKERVVDAVLSEDVDTVMFGAGMWLRNWSAESATGAISNKTPTHVSVYRAEETRARSRGIDREGMILVALMSGGDYLLEGIPGCGPKVACDAARAGFGKDLCKIGKKDKDGLKAWREKLEHQIRTNEGKHFSRRNPGFRMPADFPNMEVLGFYTNPCVSTPDKVQRLKDTLQWDQDIDFAALRSFTSDAFDWRCVGGAKKFIKNLAPAMLVRELRLRGEMEPQRGQVEEEGEEEEEEEAEKAFVAAIHGKRNHASVDGELEYRVSFTPTSLVPIDLGLEDEEEDFLPAGGETSDTEDADGFAVLPSSTADEDGESNAPSSPTKTKRQIKPYDPSQPEKLWILKAFLQIGCPLLVEDYEASFRDPKAFLKQRRQARAAGKKDGEGNIHAAPAKKAARRPKDKKGGMPENALMAYAKASKPTVDAAVAGKEEERERQPLKETNSQGNNQPTSQTTDNAQALPADFDDEALSKVGGFKLPATKIPDDLLEEVFGPERASSRPPPSSTESVEVLDLRGNGSDEPTPRPFAKFTRKELAAPKAKPAAAAAKATANSGNMSPAAKLKQKAKALEAGEKQDGERTPTQQKRLKRRPKGDAPPPPPSEATGTPKLSQRSILSYYSPSPAKPMKYARTEKEAGGAAKRTADNIINLLSSPAETASKDAEKRPTTPSPPSNLRGVFVRSPSPSKDIFSGLGGEMDFEVSPLPDTVTRRRKKKRRREGTVKRAMTAPVFGHDDNEGEGLDDEILNLMGPPPPPPDFGLGNFRNEEGDGGGQGKITVVEAMDLASPSPFTRLSLGSFGDSDLGGGFLLENEGGDGAGVGDDDDGLPSPGSFLDRASDRVEKNTTTAIQAAEPASSYPTPPVSGEEEGGGMLPPPSPPRAQSRTASGTRAGFTKPRTLSTISTASAASVSKKPQLIATKRPRPSTTTTTTTRTVSATRRSPRHSSTSIHQKPQPTAITKEKVPKKKAILLRESLEGSWKEADVEAVDLCGDGSGWRLSGGRAEMVQNGSVSVSGLGGGNASGGGKQTRWRKSEVEVLDLTGA